MRSSRAPEGAVQRPLLTVVIPTYNEAAVIADTLDKLVKVLENAKVDYEIIVVDDNSPDGTSAVVEEYSKVNPRVRLIVRRSERGLASAVFAGIMAARGSYIVVMDADQQHPPEKVPELLRKAVEGGYDIVVASRYRPGGGVEGWSRIRYLMSRIATLAARLLVREARGTTDPMSGFFLLKKDIIYNINEDKLNLKGFKILFEILSKYEGGDLRVGEVPYIFRPRAAGTSKLDSGVILAFLRQVIENSKLAKFAIVGAVGMLVNLAAMWAALHGGAPKEIASATGIEVSILSNFILNETWTFEGNFQGGWGARLLAYHASSLASALTTFITMEVTSSALALDPLYGQALGIVLGFMLNYTLASRGIWAWGRRRGRNTRG